jgi:hypothetical protein
MHGTSVVIELMGYHILKAEICLLKSISNRAIQTVQGIEIILDNGLNISTSLCPQSNIPLIPIALEHDRKYCFWQNAFGFMANTFGQINAIKSILHQTNTNLSASQKELHLWHQQLSHASVDWVRTLMRDREWLPGNTSNNNALHSGPFIPTKSRV